MVDFSLIAIMAIITPIMVAIFSPVIAKIHEGGAQLAKVLCILASCTTLFLVSWLITGVSQCPIQTQLFTISLPTGVMNAGLYVDRLALLPAFISSLFTTMALIYNVHYLSPGNKAYDINWAFNRSYPFILLFNGAMLGTLFSDNLFCLIIFWEMISVCSYALISFWSEDKTCLRAALKCFIMTHIGSIALLIVTIVIFFVAGTLEISRIGQIIPLGAPIIPVIIFLLFIAILPKTVLFPLHTWLPDGTVAPTSATVLFHVCGFQSGIYLIVRFFSDVFYEHIISAPKMPLPELFGNMSVWGFTLSFIGAITLIIGALNGIIENDFKRIVAFSTISQLGYIIMTLGLITPLGITAGLFHMISHALYCGLLFLSAGAVIYATGKHDINELGGLYRHMPVTTFCSLIGILSLSSMPLFSDFASKYLIFNALITSGAMLFTIIAFLGCILNVAIALRLLHSVFLKNVETPSLNLPIKDPPVSMLAPMVFASMVLIIFGVVPALPLVVLVIPAINQIGFNVDIISQSWIIETPLGFWDPAIIGITLVLFSIIFISIALYSKQRTKIYEKAPNEEKLKPFLCGEDISLLDDSHGNHLYHALTKGLKIERMCHLINIDRAYNSLSNKVSNFCKRLLRWDIHQNYTAAIFALVTGSVIIILIAVIMG